MFKQRELTSHHSLTFGRSKAIISLRPSLVFACQRRVISSAKSVNVPRTFSIVQRTLWNAAMTHQRRKFTVARSHYLDLIRKILLKPPSSPMHTITVRFPQQHSLINAKASKAFENLQNTSAVTSPTLRLV